LKIQAPEDDKAVPVAIQAEVVDPGDEVFLGALISQNGLEDVHVSLTNPFKVWLLPKSPYLLGAGTYEDEVLIAACADEACTQHLEGSPVTVKVTYTVTPRPLKATPTTSEVHHVIGSETVPRFQVSLESPSTRVIPWTVSSDQPWLTFSASSGTTPTTVEVTLDPEGLAPGSYEGSLLFTDTTSGQSQRVHTRFTLSVPGLSVFCPTPQDCQPLVLSGRNESRPQELMLSLEEKLLQAAPWTASIDTGTGPPWLNLSQRSGTLSHSQSLEARVTTADLSAGTYTGSITFTVLVNGHTLTQTLPVTLYYEPHRLRVSDNGVALVSTPTLRQLTHTVRVRDSEHGFTPWTASSNQDWLSVTPSGTTSISPLTVTADPTGLPPDTLHRATVTIRSTDSTVRGEELLQVGLWVGASAPASQVFVPIPYEAVETDPLRPLAYVHDGSSVFVYNLYTGTQVATLGRIGGASFGMAVSTDGSTLYVHGSETQHIVPIDLNTSTMGTGWPYTAGYGYGNFVYTRTNGAEFLLFEDGSARSAVTGVASSARFPSGPIGNPRLSVAGDGSRFCTMTDCYWLSYLERSGGGLVMNEYGSLRVDGFPLSDVALSQEGTRIYGVRHGPNSFVVLENLRPIQSLLTDAYPFTVEAGPDGRLYGATGTGMGATDVRVYDSTGAARGTFHLPEGRALRDLKISGDGQRMVMLTDSGLVFATAP
jgi:hypothetical protein